MAIKTRVEVDRDSWAGYIKLVVDTTRQNRETTMAQICTVDGTYAAATRWATSVGVNRPKTSTQAGKDDASA